MLRIMMIKTVHLLIYEIVFFLVIVNGGDSEWLNNCSTCKCYWGNAKKTANCSNHSLSSIPTTLSSEIQLLDLTENNIAEIQRYGFAKANLQNLHKLYLRSCTLMELNRDAFQGLNVLIELDLSNNLLRELHTNTFSVLEKLRKLILNNNELEFLTENLLSNLPYLHIVEFRHNRIVRLEPMAFFNLPSLNSIDLSFNNLTKLKVNSFVNLTQLVGISLEQNPWNCTCHLLEFRNFAVKNNYSPQLTACHQPKHLKGKTWIELQPEKFACHPEIIQPLRGIRGGPFGSQTEATADNVTLTCRIRAAPKPKILWAFNKRSINLNDRRYNVINVMETTRPGDDVDIYTTELTIYGVRSTDKGVYTCMTENEAGMDAADLQLTIGSGSLNKSIVDDSSTNLLLIICISIVLLLLLLAIVAIALCFCCRRTKRYLKDGSVSENGLMTSKLDKTQNGSMFEGSVITDVQKSLLAVNPVEKPPRRGTDAESIDAEDGPEIQKTLLNDKEFANHDDETNSVALSDTTARSRQAFVDDGHGTSLPPDLLSFQAKVMPQSPSMQSSMSNLPDNRLYGKSPLASPVYQHVLNGTNSPGNEIYGANPNTYRTLQHPKNRNLALLNNSRSTNASPFLPAPIVYPPVIMKQGYMTIPRKPRAPSWTPSCSTTLSEFQASPLGGIASNLEEPEPVYDNLGVRTTASGNSMLNLTKIAGGSSPRHNNSSSGIRYTMKDRPLPATPKTIAITNETAINSKSPKIYEPIHEIGSNAVTTSDTEPLYGGGKNNDITIIPDPMGTMSSNGLTTLGKLSKIPPRPPPKPKKKFLATATITQEINQRPRRFEDEGEDGTEV